MKVETSFKPAPLTANFMRIGDIAIIDKDEKMFVGTVLLRTFDSFVSLNSPSNTWSISSGSNFKVTILPAGSTVTLTVEG